MVRPLIRKDSLVSVESDGLVGDKFLLIHAGTDQAALAVPGDMLPSKEQIELSAVVAKVNRLLDQASGTMADVSHHADGTLDTLKGTIENTNGLVTGLRKGKGTVGMLLSDEATAQQVRAAIGNTRQATEGFDQITDKANVLVTHANEMVSDLESRDLPEKAQQTLDNVKSASVQLNDSSTRLNQALTGALASDATGVDAAQNIRESLSNVNTATANLADDSEALKHEFFFRGFFRKRGFYTLSTLSPDEYRSESFFSNSSNQRKWLPASDIFVELPDGRQVLSPKGTATLDNFGAEAKDTISGKAMVIEGYASNAAPAKQLLVSKTRAALVKRYLEQHFQVNPTNIGIVPLNAMTPQNTGKTTWDGVCVVILARKK
jgi:phospholipid/cholesterol/gamma-HCH transport system substrate-binding protein